MALKDKIQYFVDELNVVLPAELVDRVRTYVTLSNAEKKANFQKFTIDVKDKTKDERKEIHKRIAHCLPGFSSETREDKDQKQIEFYYSETVNRKPSNQNLSFVLRKRNWDTMQALNKIAKSIRKRTGDFFFAGTKDKRAQTVQRVVAKNVSKEELAALVLSKSWRKDEISVCALDYTQELITIGQLTGNRFTIALRFVEEPPFAHVQENCENLKQHGFFNYFGLQRFGSKDNHRTNTIGKFIVLKEYEKAFKAILTADTADAEKNRVVAEFLESKNTERALKELHFKHSVERTLIDGLRKAGRSNFLGAIMNITKTLRNLYIHAYQSLLWNRALSRRLVAFGKHIVAGDYVNENDGPVLLSSHESAEKYQLCDLMIPILGRDTEMHESSIVARLYADLLEEEGLTQRNFEDHPLSFAISGGWRRALTRPLDFKWKMIAFAQWNSDLLDIEGDESELYVLPGLEGSHKALVVQFSLPKANYATMLIRELLHRTTDMSSENQIVQKLKLADSLKEVN